MEKFNDYMTALKTVSNAVREYVEFFDLKPLSMNQMLEAYLYQTETFGLMEIHKAGKDIEPDAKPFLFWNLINERKNGKKQWSVHFRYSRNQIIIN